MIDRRIKFRHLQCFLEVARQKSVVKAADTLAVHGGIESADG